MRLRRARAALRNQRGGGSGCCRALRMAKDCQAVGAWQMLGASQDSESDFLDSTADTRDAKFFNESIFSLDSFRQTPRAKSRTHTSARHKSKADVEMLVAKRHPQRVVPSSVRKVPAPKLSSATTAPLASRTTPMKPSGGSGHRAFLHGMVGGTRRCVNSTAATLAPSALQQKEGP